MAVEDLNVPLHGGITRGRVTAMDGAQRGQQSEGETAADQGPVVPRSLNRERAQEHPRADLRVGLHTMTASVPTSAPATNNRQRDRQPPKTRSVAAAHPAAEAKSSPCAVPGPRIHEDPSTSIQR